MVFSTREFYLSVLDYTSIKFGLVAQRRWPIWASLLVAGKCIQFFHSPLSGSFGLWVMIAGVLLPIIAYGSSYLDACSPLNTIYYQPRIITFDDEGIYVQIQEGDSTLIRWSSVVDMQRWSSFYLLFTSKDYYIPIPIESFPDRSTRLDFEYLLQKQRHEVEHMLERTQSKNL